MAKPLILAIDIGSSGIRAGLYDGDATPIARSFARIENSFVATAGGGFETDAEVCFKNVAAAIDAVMERSKRIRGEIIGVASCAIWHSLVGVDARGRPTTKVLGWADGRAGKYSQVLKQRFDEGSVHGRTGAYFHSTYWPAKLLWLHREQPATFQRTGCWLAMSDYVAQRLCGATVTSISMASGTGCFDQRKSDWDSDLLRYLKVKRSQLPNIGSTGSRLALKFAKRWPRLGDAIWFPPIADGAADHIGSCGIDRARASLMVGTSGAMRVAYVGEPPKRLPDGLWCYRVDRKRVIVGGALSDGGNLYEMLTKTLAVPRNAEDQMRQRGADAHGLTVMPFFFGERSTGYREDARGTVLGLGVSHDAVDILQAAMEAVAYRFAAIYDRLLRVADIREVVASGGALRDSTVWTQIIADVLGRDLTVNSTTEAAMRGAVLLALESLGKIEGIDNFSVPAASTLAFHPECHAAYTAARKRHEEHYKRTTRST